MCPKIVKIGSKLMENMIHQPFLVCFMFWIHQGLLHSESDSLYPSTSYSYFPVIVTYNSYSLQC